MSGGAGGGASRVPVGLVIALLYGSILVSETVWAAVIPLAPLYKSELGLDGTATGVLVGTASVVILVASVPAGILVDRLGAGWPTVAAAAAVAVSCAGQGFGRSYLVLLVARGLFGLGMAIVWTSALVWLAELVGPERRTRAIALCVTLAGVAGIVGPGFAGLLAGSGVELPFSVLGIVAAAIAVGLVPAAAGAGGAAGAQRLLDTVRLLARSQLAIAGLVLFAIGGLAMAAMNLLVPLSYDAHGISADRVGVAFSVAGGGFLATSAVIGRVGDRAVSQRLTSRAVVGLGLLSLLPLASEAPAVLTGYLLARAPLSAVVFTCAFPLAMLGAHAVGVPSGAVLGLSNAIWAAATFAGPAAAGALLDAGGRGVAYAATAALTLAVGVVLLRLARASALLPAEAQAPVATGSPRVDQSLQEPA